MVELALQVLSFLFLCWVGFMGLILLACLFGKSK
jgi:hypothetical protein